MSDAYIPLVEEAFMMICTKPQEPISSHVVSTIHEIIHQLNRGTLRVAEPTKTNGWLIHEWIKKAILIFFKMTKSEIMAHHGTLCFDKIPSKFQGWSKKNFTDANIRVVPPAHVRFGAFIGSDVVLMPSFINIGAYIGSSSMIDAWATVGSCAQIGERVHISGGVGIGGVLEPIQKAPTIIEDDCFIGARSEIVEGVVVEKNCVLSMGVFIGQSTPIFDRATQKIDYGRVPSGSVVIPGSIPSSDGTHGRYAAIIVKQIDEQTLKKVSINDLLRS